MKRFGLFLLKNNIHLMTLVFIVTQRFIVMKSGMSYKEFVGNALRTLFGKKNDYPKEL